MCREKKREAAREPRGREIAIELKGERGSRGRESYRDGGRERVIEMEGERARERESYRDEGRER